MHFGIFGASCRMALNQIALLEGRELAYKEKLSHYEGDNSKVRMVPSIKFR